MHKWVSNTFPRTDKFEGEETLTRRFNCPVHDVNRSINLSMQKREEQYESPSSGTFHRSDIFRMNPSLGNPVKIMVETDQF